MSLYRKKPVVIEAFDWHNANTPAPKWFADAIVSGKVYFQGGDNPYYTIETLEGKHRADPGDFIIQGIQGELYPCKPDIFEATYERVEP